MTSKRLGRGIAAATLLAGLTLSGCSAHPGAAAVVDGEQISQHEVSRAVTDFAAVTGQQVDAAAMLSTLIVAPVLIEVGAQHDLAVSDEEAVDLLDRQAESTGTTAPEDGYGDGVIQLAKMTLVNSNLSALPNAAQVVEEVNARIMGADVEVSPRYGEFDGGSITPEALPWIVPAS